MTRRRKPRSRLSRLHAITWQTWEEYGPKDAPNGICPMCSTYSHKPWCWYPQLLQVLGKPLDDKDRAYLFWKAEFDRRIPWWRREEPK